MEEDMGTIVKAEYIQKKLCQKCLLADHEERYVRNPFRKVVQDVRGVIACANCGKRVSGGYVVIYEYTGKRAS
jgi:ribosomal protein S27AE